MLELVYYDVAVQKVNHYTVGNPTFFWEEYCGIDFIV